MDLHGNLCKSVFQKNTINKELYTAAWIALINRMLGQQYARASAEEGAWERG